MHHGGAIVLTAIGRALYVAAIAPLLTTTYPAPDRIRSLAGVMAVSGPTYQK
jgi:hypothetical protein